MQHRIVVTVCFCFCQDFCRVMTSGNNSISAEGNPLTGVFSSLFCIANKTHLKLEG